jgi:hypothetical protein
LLGLLLELAVTNRTRLTRTRQVADRATRRDLLDNDARSTVPKGQVENQVGPVRERFFTPRLRVASYDELNGLLVDRCVVHIKSGERHWHGAKSDTTMGHITITLVGSQAAHG